jgi:2-keto-4-pentenoate hydratase/2-oxohepta-3-ene-1,7-dioic acid hydratase in catechol pathway
MKPDTALLPKHNPFYLPDFSKEVHHEAELVIRISKAGKNIAEQFASRYYDTITVGIDFTARDLQQRQKDKGLPWEISKSFDHSAPVGEFVPVSALHNKKKIAFHLDINGKTVQQATSDLMIFSFDKIIAYASQFFTLRKGDFIFTGTPKGVSAVKEGDKLEAYLEGKKILRVDVK